MSTKEQLLADFRALITHHNAIGAILGRLSALLAAGGLDPGGGSTDPSKPVIPPSDALSEAEKQAACYFDRYHDVRAVAKKRGLNRQQAVEWAEHHFATWGKREGRVWGCSSEPDGTVDDTGLPSVSSIGGGFVWKPQSESRGHVLVVLLPASWPRADSITLEWAGGKEVVPWTDVDGHNGGRWHYFAKRPGSAYGSPTIMTVGDKKYAVANPGARYG